MTSLDRMKADAAECNRAMWRSMGRSGPPNYNAKKTKSLAAARRKERVRSFMDEGLSAAQIAKRLRKPISTIKGDIHWIRNGGDNGTD